MVWKSAPALLILLLLVGVVVAEEIKGTFVKIENGKLTLTVDDKDRQYTVPPDLKLKRKFKDGKEQEVFVEDVLAKMKAGTKLIVDVEKDKVKSFRFDRSKSK